MQNDSGLVKRFFGYVRIDEASKCWPWLGAHQRQGYGEFKAKQHKCSLAHRMSYLLHKGPIPKGMFVMHSCDNPPCVNPNHLSLGTALDNIADMVAKGRHLEGRKAALAKLRARTHCKNGHTYTEAGFYYYGPTRGRECKKCVSQRMAEIYQNRKAAAL